MRQIISMAEKMIDKEIEDIYKVHLMLRQANDMNHKCREDELKKYNITPEQSAVLICIHFLGEKATPANTSRWLTREPHSVLIILRRMQKMGFIEMKPHQKNKHMFRITLTKTGQEAYEDAIKLRSVIDIFAVLPKEERQYLFYILKKIRDRGYKLMKLDSRDCDKLGDSFKLPGSNGKNGSSVKRKSKASN
jgi:DNA-binding MarR family transcriptional regulator